METKLKFKVGDRVRVKSLEWYINNKNEKGDVDTDGNNGVLFTEIMSDLCGSILKIIAVEDDHYTMSGIIYYWQDWMLEDKPVTEEKQNKNDMEKKEMTKEEVFEFLKDTKILCTSKEESIKIQVALFAFGIEWISGKKGIDEDKYLLFINNRLKIQHTSHIDSWMDDVNKRIEPNDILAITLKEEEKPKFDPNTLQDFQKVLYRSSNADWWRLGFFEYYNEIQNKKYWIIGQDVQPYEQCVPYNEETEHLKGKILDAPEFYKNW